ncbi:MAG: DUF2071 domain-containing protein [Planctomycetes bacterium]|nr:DUF2071 domain-containing protein [Planctomycetota bacterium]
MDEDSDTPSARGAWVMAMRWQQLLFAHWPVPAAALRPHIAPLGGPAGLELDEHDGTAWLAVVPFRMTGVRPRCVPALPRLSRFCELNLRTYVTCQGRPGVWFFSLDAADPLAVRVARAAFHLPYFDARMGLVAEADGTIRYRSERTHRGAPAARFVASYRPTGAPFRAAPGSREWFFTERYSLYTADRRGRLLRGDVLHEPWVLQAAEWEPQECDMGRIAGVELPARGVAHLLYADDLLVRATRVRAVGPRPA